MANSDRTAITALEPRTGTAASSGVGAVGERGRSGARGCAGGAGTGKEPGSVARGGARDVMDALDSRSVVRKSVLRRTVSSPNRNR